MTTEPDTRPVGRTGLTVSRIGFGTAPIGRATVPEADAIAAAESALAAGVTLFDTAPLYGAGRAERLLGAALRGVPRDSYVLSTKVGRIVTPDGRIVRADTRDGVLRSIEASLARLGVGRLDIVLLHDPDDHEREALDAVFPALAELRSQGVIRAIGAGMNQWEMPARFARAADFDCFLLAGRYTLLEQTAAATFLPLCRERGIGVFLGGVYNSGVLATGPTERATYNYKPLPPGVRERVGRIAATCERFGVPLHTAATQFPLAHPAVTSAVLGAVSPAEVAANLAALTDPVPQALWDALREDGLLDPAAPTPLPA